MDIIDNDKVCIFHFHIEFYLQEYIVLHFLSKNFCFLFQF